MAVLEWSEMDVLHGSEAGSRRSRRIGAAGRSLARAGGRPQVQPAVHARSSKGRMLARSDRNSDDQGQATRVQTSRLRASRAQLGGAWEAG